MLQAVWTLPCVLALKFWPGVYQDAWGTYAVATVLLSYPYCREYSILRRLPAHRHVGSILIYGRD
jgi:hypothetical protein